VSFRNVRHGSRHCTENSKTDLAAAYGLSIPRNPGRSITLVPEDSIERSPQNNHPAKESVQDTNLALQGIFHSREASCRVKFSGPLIRHFAALFEGGLKVFDDFLGENRGGRGRLSGFLRCFRLQARNVEAGTIRLMRSSQFRSREKARVSLSPVLLRGLYGFE
jgi:hypothetical protein